MAYNEQVATGDIITEIWTPEFHPPIVDHREITPENANSKYTRLCCVAVPASITTLDDAINICEGEYERLRSKGISVVKHKRVLVPADAVNEEVAENSRTIKRQRINSHGLSLIPEGFFLGSVIDVVDIRLCPVGIGRIIGQYLTEAVADAKRPYMLGDLSSFQCTDVDTSQDPGIIACLFDLDVILKKTKLF